MFVPPGAPSGDLCRPEWPFQSCGAQAHGGLRKTQPHRRVRIAICTASCHTKTFRYHRNTVFSSRGRVHGGHREARQSRKVVVFAVALASALLRKSGVAKRHHVMHKTNRKGNTVSGKVDRKSRGRLIVSRRAEFTSCHHMARDCWRSSGSPPGMNRAPPTKRQPRD